MTVAGQRVLHSDRIPEVVSQAGIELAILTVPAHAAQRVADALVKAGVRAIWNFAPTRISLPDDIEVRQENMIVGLLALSYYLAQREK